MTQLKTLKDFDCNKPTAYLLIEGFCPVCQEKRQEAIKWIKKMKRIQQEEILKTNKPERAWGMAIYQFKDFFNISEEDLK